MHASPTSAAELVLFGILLSLASAVRAQPQPRDVGIFADAEGTQSIMGATSGVPFQIHGVAFELDGQVKGWELGVDFPPQLTVLGLELNPAGPSRSPYLPNLWAGSPTCLEGSPNFRLFRASLAWFVSEEMPLDVLICVREFRPPSPSLDGRPGYLQCEGGLVPFGLAQSGGEFYPDGCLVINPTHPLEGPVALEDIGMGTLKARFQTN